MLKTVQVCFAPESKVCRGCYTAHFCSKVCLRQDWEVHKQLCSIIREEFQEVTLEWDPVKDPTMLCVDVVTGKIKIHTKASEINEKKKHHILKVQKQFEEGINDIKAQMGKKPGFLATALAVYSQHHEIYGYISPKSPLYARLKRSIEDEGLLNYKIYIKSCERYGKLWVNPSRILQPRTW